MSNLQQIFKSTHQRDSEKGQIVLYQGEITENMFYIESGYIKVYDILESGNEKLLMILGPGDIFPLIWSFEKNEPLHYFYETIEPSKINLTSRKNLINSVKNDHELAYSTLQYFVNRSDNLMNRLECIDSTSAKHKVAQVLYYLSHAHGKPDKVGWLKIQPEITQQSIADMAGITRETASIQLKHLEESCIYSNDNDELLVNHEGLESFLQKSEVN